MAPTSQKAGVRPISFSLITPEIGRKVDLIIRPEDLTWNEPALMTPTQTFNGAWIDDFGPGVSSIQISGHTGWRGGHDLDGAAQFALLKSQVWTDWHAARAKAVKDGQYPDDVVTLIFADSLDNIVRKVVPGNFTLKRSRSRPLLMMYQISMTVLSAQLSPIPVDPIDLTKGANLPAAAHSLADSLKKLQAAEAVVHQFVDTQIIGPVHAFMAMTNSVLSAVQSTVNTVTGVVSSVDAQLVGLAADLAQTGRNAFYTIGAVVNLPAHIAAQVSAVASAYDNALCVLRNAFTLVDQYPDYTGLYGASNCSSTVGGSPISPFTDTNPFTTVFPVAGSSPAVTLLARSSISAMGAADPVLSPMGLTGLAGHLTNVAGGVSDIP